MPAQPESRRPHGSRSSPPARTLYRNGAVAGLLVFAVCIGLILGGNQSPVLIGFAFCECLFAGGQLWARRRL
jgi:hypothetical protein